MGETTVGGGVSRRDLIKRSAVAGAIVWAAPVLDSSAAWGTTPANCNECDGLTLYSKYAPGNSNTEGNQCLAPCQPVTVISHGTDTVCGFFSVDDTVATNENRADITFENRVRLIRTAIKSTSDCYVTSCSDNFCSVRTYSPGLNPTCNTEMSAGTAFSATPLVPPLFEFYSDSSTVCGSQPGASCGCVADVVRVKYSTEALNKPLNFIEIIMCLKGTSVLPPGCS